MSKKKKTLYYIYIFITALIFGASIYMKKEFKNETIEEYLFYLFNGMGSSDYSMVIYILKNYLITYILLVLGLIFITNGFNFKKEFKFYPIKILDKYMNYLKVFLLVVAILLCCNRLSVFGYIYDSYEKSDIYEKEYKYIDYSDIINNNDTKKNLVMIYIESLETSFLSRSHGGLWDYELLDELNILMEEDDSIYFASDDYKQGMSNIFGTTWTTASIISSTSGTPFKIPNNNIKFNYDNFLRKSITLGDILKHDGYHNEVISGASVSFGGLDKYFKVHGDYNIIDPSNVNNYKINVDYDTFGEWGFNDKYMFDLAKNRIAELSKKDEPFNMTLIGIDSHPMDGFKAEYTVDKFDKNYENVYATESFLISEFVHWIKEQPYYKDTTIVIVGDHLCMQTSFVGDLDLSKRGRFNLFINSSTKTDNTKNRLSSSIDLYPTVLSSLGYSIKDNKIGLGVNLFSNEKTLVDKYQVDYLNKELRKKSLVYNDLLKE